MVSARKALNLRDRPLIPWVVGILSLLTLFLYGCGPSTPGATPTPVWEGTTSEGDPYKGSPEAPVTIIEYSEYQCPFCARFVKETLPLIKDRYIATGKARLIFRDFPVHQQAIIAAGAAACALEQGSFWKMHDTLFAKQEEWSGNQDFMELYNKYAQDLGLDLEAFTSCLESGEYIEGLRKDVEAGEAAGVGGTPTFFINDQLVVGAQPFEVFEEAIEQELAK